MNFNTDSLSTCINKYFLLLVFYFIFLPFNVELSYGGGLDVYSLIAVQDICFCKRCWTKTDLFSKCCSAGGLKIGFWQVIGFYGSGNMFSFNIQQLGKSRFQWVLFKMCRNGRTTKHFTVFFAKLKTLLALHATCIEFYNALQHVRYGFLQS